MSDQRFRELQRRWTVTRSVSDEEALLREAMRIGVLDPAHLRLAALFGHRAAQMIDVAVGVFPERPTLSDVRGHMAAGIAAAGSCAVSQATASLLDLIPTQPEHAERLGQLREWVSRVLAGEDGGVEGLAPTGESTIDAAQAICLAAKRARSDSRPSAAVARTLAVCVGLVAGERESRLPWATPTEVAQVWRSRLVPWLLSCLSSNHA